MGSSTYQLTQPVSIGSVWLRGRQLLFCETVATFPSYLYIFFIFVNVCCLEHMQDCPLIES